MEVMKMEKMKRSEKYKTFKEYGIPRYMMLDEKDKKKESYMFIFIALLMLILALIGKTDGQKAFGAVSLFFSSLIGVLNR